MCVQSSGTIGTGCCRIDERFWRGTKKKSPQKRTGRKTKILTVASVSKMIAQLSGTKAQCLLGPGPIHLCLGSSLSDAIWMSKMIVSLMWQPELGCVYLFSLSCKENIANTSWYIMTYVFMMSYSPANRSTPLRCLDPILTFDMIYLLRWIKNGGVAFIVNISNKPNATDVVSA